MTNTEVPPPLLNCQEVVRRYFASCIARATEKLSLDASSHEITRATLDLFILHYHTDISEEVENSLDIAGVEIEDTPGSIVITKLNRFSGIDLNEP